MDVGARLREELVRLISVRRRRRILIALAITVLTGLTVLGLVTVTRSRGHEAVQSDTRIAIGQTGEELLRRLQSRRGTLTLLRDTLNRQPTLSAPQLKAMGESAVDHTRHLLGVGLIRHNAAPVWWASPTGLRGKALIQVNRAIVQRTKLHGIWRVPSTSVTEAEQPILIMLEPLRASALRRSAVVGIFDVKRLLSDFFSSGAPQRYPVTVLDGNVVLYRSDDWQPATEEVQPIVATRTIKVDATQWTIQMQPGSTGVVQTLSWLNILLIGLSLTAGAGIVIIVWILAARAWILQRAVTRRTAALRRALQRVRQLAVTDELTGLYNRRFFLKRWAWELQRAKRYHRPLACLMIDVNRFKLVNDRLGHHTGDLVLKQVAEELKTLLRESDILARFGGDEFVIALPETSYDQASRVAEKLRKANIRVPAGRRRGVSAVSLGVGLSHTAKPTDRSGDILEAADNSLYAHKRRTKSPASPNSKAHPSRT